ncbi:MAG: DUF968 domain-containing protein [Rhodospirillaceae bacterium]|nr:DUF968 domain-containing protein [Rhodospirillaceae bacterium]
MHRSTKPPRKEVCPSTKPVPPHCKRIRNKEHLRFVASQSCLICGRSPSHAHHIKFAQPRAMGRKVNDEWAVPLCYIRHRALHDRGDKKHGPPDLVFIVRVCRHLRRRSRTG